ncbi:MAG: hypothetical protein ACLQFR_17295 [Streptosporangiaceae bacterium]
MTVAVSHHAYNSDISIERTRRAWESWLVKALATTGALQAGRVVGFGGVLAARLVSSPARSMTSTPIPTPHNVQSAR